MNRVSSKQIEFYALLEQQKREFREDVAEIESAGLEASIIRAEAAIEGSTHRAEALKQQATYSAAAILGITAITRGLLPSGQVLTTLLYSILAAADHHSYLFTIAACRSLTYRIHP